MSKNAGAVRSIATNSAYSIAAKALIIGLRLAYVVLLARLLDTADYGLLFYALTWYVLFMPLTAMGQDLELAKSIGAGSPDAADIVSATFTMRVYATLCAFVAVGSLGWFLNPDDQGRELLLIIALAIIPRSLTVWCHLVYISSETTRYVLQQDLIFRPLEVALAVAALLLGGTQRPSHWFMSLPGPFTPSPR